MSLKKTAERIGLALRARSCLEDRKDQLDRLNKPILNLGLFGLFFKAKKKMSQGKKFRSKEFKKTDPVPENWQIKIKQVEACGSHIETLAFPGEHLIPARVKRWSIKEYHLVFQKIQELVKERPISRKLEITVLSEQDDGAKSASDALWEEMIKAKEERQFQLGRITKYFS